MPALALINSQQALLELIERHSEEGVGGLADLENLPGGIFRHLFEETGQTFYHIAEHLLLEELEMLDNITSCNVVDNYLMLDEYEQNLCKEHEQPPATGLRRLRKWSLARQGSSLGLETGGRKRSVNNNLTGVQAFINKRTITTIQESEAGAD